MKTTIECSVCHREKPAAEFESAVKRHGFPIVTKSCQSCRGEHNATYGADRIRERQQEDITAASELNRLINGRW